MISLRDQHVLREKEKAGGRVNANLAEGLRLEIAQLCETVAECRENVPRRFFTIIDSAIPG
jgi:hypothetical protein